MQYRVLLFILLIGYLPNLDSYSANNNFPVGARSWGMGNASVAVPDVWSVHHNQASLAEFQNITGSMYFENKFILSQLGLKSLSLIIPVGKDAFGLNVNHYGYEIYNEQKIGIAYGKKLGEKFNIGVQLDYLNTFISELGSKKNVTFEAGILAKLNKQLFLGAHVFNPVKVKINDYEDERIPAIMRLGMAYRFSRKVLLSVETEKDIYFKPIFKTGIEYQPVEILYLRTGLSTDPTFFTFGFGLVLKKWKLDFAASYHQTLGVTPHISLGYEIAKKSKN